GPWRLSGPGIETQRRIDVGDAEALMRLLATNRARFPRGLDAILTCGARLAAIPRSTRLEQYPEEESACMSQ
ncbi:phosphonate C-P lyase system protein PhnH, partial [Enterobacter asburiae]|uniref:phosphonate C-P lyase system protein PhnH n=1 Tax=Enterobacter asburiae TaxID=61645 RepID=UPI0021D169D2